ncbi:MAG: four helix bundle protein [Acidobacteria bacterium]|nr:MAG: four helix bundle protein [Acidobacteriota bacterium]
MKFEGGNAQDIRQRSFAYALRAIKLYQALVKRKDGAGWALGRQYLKSATSIGANIEEAQSGESRADFIHKYGIAQKEARESLYWLRLLAESRILSNERLNSIIQERDELVAIITAIIVKIKRQPEGRRSEE